ncbi:MAG TPA: tetratricopeptide repeat protein [Acidobacteriaceae bacterium]|nr:tetratricopeptide repeat protein [Acidobacteriaceae bacterium]
MHLSRIQRFTRFPLLITAVFLIATLPAHAASKEIIELQTQVQQLMDMMQRLQSTVDSRFGLVQHLVEQSTDTVNQLSQSVNGMQQKLNSQAEANSGKLDSVSGQVQSLNDSLDELKTRIGKLDKQLQDMQSQLQNIQSQPAGGAGAQGGQPQGAGALPPSGFAGDQSVPPGQGGLQQPGPQAGGAQAPPLQETYQGALRDYNAAHYDVSASEFNDVLHYYPNDDLAGNAQFYLGEIAYKQQKYREAVKAYNVVLENFSGSPKAPAAQLHKGFSLLQLSQREPGIHELRSLIQRHPQTPEAVQARRKLNELGVRITPR